MDESEHQNQNIVNYHRYYNKQIYNIVLFAQMNKKNRKSSIAEVIREKETYDDGSDQYEQVQQLQIQNPDEKGFQKRIYQQQIFIFKAVNIPGLPKNQQVKKLVTSEQTKLLITKSNKIYRWRPKLEPEFKICQISLSKDKLFQIRNAYFDEKGTHCIVTCSLGYNLYINSKQNKIKFLSKLKGLHVKAAAFVGFPSDPQVQPKNDSKSTGDIIISSGDGVISILSIQILDGQVVQHHQTPALIIQTSFLDLMAIQVIRLNQVSGKYLLVLLSTASAIHVIFGEQQPISTMFKKYKQSSQKMVIQRENGGAYSSLKVCFSKMAGRPSYVLWMNGRKLQLFKLPDRIQKITQNNCLKQQEIKLLKTNDVQTFKQYPIGIGITQFHYYILYSDSLTIVSLVTKRMVLNEVFKGPVFGMVCEPKLNSFWIYDGKTITKLDTSREGSDVWKVYVSEKKYKQAYALCKAKNQSLAFVSSLYADDLFQKEHYTKAATLYIETSRTLQQIFLKFLQVDTFQSRQGLQIYLNLWLSKLEPEKKTQRCLLISWLVELLVYDINNLQKTKDQHKADLLPQKQSDLIQLLSTNLDVINDQLIFDIMMSYGRIKNLKQFAELRNNIEKIVLHFLYNEQYDKAITYLEGMTDLQQVTQVIYKHSYVFFSYQPERTINLLLKNIKKFQSTKLLPGIINIPRQKRSSGIDLLKYCVENLKQKSFSVHNLLIYFYATSPRQRIVQMIDLMKKGKMYFSLDFALRLFKSYSVPEAQIIVYGQMRMYQKAVLLALQMDNEQLAKQFANRPKHIGKKRKQEEKKSQKKSEVDEQKKKLWLQIAKYYLNKKQKMNHVMQLTKQSKVLKIQDLLPHFNPNIKLENFKEEISQSLRAYFQNINRLKDQMESYSSNAEQLKSEEKYIQDRCFQIDSSHKCEQCFKTLFNAKFYMFPCMHGFHMDCLFEVLKNQTTFSKQKQQRVNTLMSQISTIESRIKDKLQNGDTNERKSSFSFIPTLSMPSISVSNLIWSSNQVQKTVKIQSEEKEIKKKKDEITSLIAPQCIYCGPGLVQSIVIPFDNPELKDSWKI